MKNENPMMNKLRAELRSTNCKLDRPTEAIVVGAYYQRNVAGGSAEGVRLAAAVASGRYR